MNFYLTECWLESARGSVFRYLNFTQVLANVSKLATLNQHSTLFTLSWHSPANGFRSASTGSAFTCSASKVTCNNCETRCLVLSLFLHIYSTTKNNYFYNRVSLQRGTWVPIGYKLSVRGLKVQKFKQGCCFSLGDKRLENWAIKQFT